MYGRTVLRAPARHATNHQATLLEFQALCDRALADPALWPRLADSLLAGVPWLRVPTPTPIDKLLPAVADCAELTNVRIRVAVLRPQEDVAQFAAERSIKALQQLVLTALGVLQGGVHLLRF